MQSAATQPGQPGQPQQTTMVFAEANVKQQMETATKRKILGLGVSHYVKVSKFNRPILAKRLRDNYFYVLLGS